MTDSGKVTATVVKKKSGIYVVTARQRGRLKMWRLEVTEGGVVSDPTGAKITYSDIAVTTSAFRSVGNFAMLDKVQQWWDGR